MSRPLNGSFDPIKAAFAQYLNRWRSGIIADYIDTKAVQAFVVKPFSSAVQWVPSRMVDQVEDMLEAYRKNENGPKGQTTLFPVVLLAMDENFTQTGADWGGLQIGRDYVQIEEGGSWYGYRHNMMDRRVQVVIIASEGGSAQSLAAQMASFMFEPRNRLFDAVYTFGQYNVATPVELESNRPDWMDIKLEGVKNLKVLAADLTLKCIIPWWDAPAAGQPNDGSTNNPPGYPAMTVVTHTDRFSRSGSTTSDNGTEWGVPE